MGLLIITKGVRYELDGYLTPLDFTHLSFILIERDKSLGINEPLKVCFGGAGKGVEGLRRITIQS